MLSDKQHVRDLVHICYQMGIRHVVISPGSRNAPLTISFDNHSGFKCYSIVDERTAAFFALGISQQLRVPTLLVCTSGSALLNYAPAIVEAYYQHIPLLVLTADRPPEYIDIGDGQTMRQTNVYHNYILASYDLYESGDSLLREENIDNIARAIRMTRTPTPGPVHINIPLSEPLYNTAKEKPLDDLSIPPLERKMHNNLPDLSLHLDQLPQYPKVLLLCGMMPPSKEWNNALASFVETHPNVVVLSETTSNISHPKVISQIDRTLAGFLHSENAGDFIPDLLITMGHNLISKHIKKWLRKATLKAHWHVDDLSSFPDTFHQLTFEIPMSPSRFLSGWRDITPDENYARKWHDVVDAVRLKHHRFLRQIPFVDLRAYDPILQNLLPNTVLQMGNSTVVRYVQLFENRPDIQYFSNRGVSGIDGCSSTAMGAAAVSGQPVVLLTGDIAFGYDANAFWHNYLDSNLKIIVFNNGGGSIFRFIDGPDTTGQLDSLFVTHRPNTIEGVVRRYDMPYIRVEDLPALQVVLPSFLSAKEDKPAVLEIKTDGRRGAKVLRDYFKALSSSNSVDM